MSVTLPWQSKVEENDSVKFKGSMVSTFGGCNKVMFGTQLLQSMKILVKLPVMLRVDNVGFIFMTGNVTAKSSIKHVNTRYKYVNKYTEDGRVKIVFVKSIPNYSNILIINLIEELYEQPSKKIIGEKSA